jgi:hypothetical protein
MLVTVGLELILFHWLKDWEEYLKKKKKKDAQVIHKRLKYTWQ